MKSDRLLYLSTHQMRAYRWSGGVLAAEEQFEASGAGYQQFAGYLAQHPESVYAVLANVQEEGFQIETIPFLQGADRKALVQRKLRQLFFNAPLTTSLSLGYEKTRRKDERLLLAALTNNELLSPWLSRILDSGIALSGFHSLPMLGVQLLARLQLKEERCLLLSVQDQSIRQSYFEHGELHFSRLTPLQNSSISGLAQAFSSETGKLIQYLTSQRLLARNQSITVHILTHGTAVAAVRERCVDTDVLHFDFIDVDHCASKVGLKSLPADSHSDHLFLHLVAATPPRAQFADESHRHNYRLRQLRYWAIRLGAIALAGSLLFAGTLMVNVWRTNQEANELKAEATLLRQRYEAIAQTFPTLQMSHDSLRRVMDRFDTLEKTASSPATLMAEISRALNQSPSIDLESIEWKLGGTESANASMGTTPSKSPAAIKSTPEGSESAVIRGLIRMGPNANPRQVIGAFNQLVEALKSNTSLQIDILQQPFDVESGKSLRGGDTRVETDKPRPFSLQVTRKIGS